MTIYWKTSTLHHVNNIQVRYMWCVFIVYCALSSLGLFHIWQTLKFYVILFDRHYKVEQQLSITLYPIKQKHNWIYYNSPADKPGDLNSISSEQLMVNWASPLLRSKQTAACSLNTTNRDFLSPHKQDGQSSVTELRSNTFSPEAWQYVHEETRHILVILQTVSTIQEERVWHDLTKNSYSKMNIIFWATVIKAQYHTFIITDNGTHVLTN